MCIRDRASRGKKPLTRYFPEVVDRVRAALPVRCALDAEIVVRRGEPGAQRLDWEALAQRIHPAASRVAKLAVATPAEVVAFDLLSTGEQAWLERPFADRRRALEAVSYTHLDVYKRQLLGLASGARHDYRAAHQLCRQIFCAGRLRRLERQR